MNLLITRKVREWKKKFPMIHGKDIEAGYWKATDADSNHHYMHLRGFDAFFRATLREVYEEGYQKCKDEWEATSLPTNE